MIIQMSYLTSVKFELPQFKGSEELVGFLSNFGINSNGVINFSSSNIDFYPKLSLGISDVDIPEVHFISDEQIAIKLTNSTGKTKTSPHKYKPISISEFLSRFKSVEIKELDHLGFDLPWFNGIHPDILELRKVLPNKCAYHKWPENEEWDFILPATEKEISSTVKLDYTEVRRPKLEIVSIEKVSTPIVQIDFAVQMQYEDLVELFPEAIHVSTLKNIWVYIKNEIGIDICFVVNEHDSGDWSDFFKDCRVRDKS